jgi:hypothetical protein
MPQVNRYPASLAPSALVTPIDSGPAVKSDRLGTGIRDRVRPESVIGLDWNR